MRLLSRHAVDCGGNYNTRILVRVPERLVRRIVLVYSRL